MALAHEMERFAGILAHEIRNPLASATTNLAVACDLMETSDPRAPFLRRAESELDRIRDLLSACLCLATAGRVRREHCDIGALLRDVLDRRGEDPVEISIGSRSEDLLHFAVDPGLLTRCIENLIENAIRECGEQDGRIRIQASVKEDHLLLSVEDSGPGVPESKREEIFDAFVSGGKGSGLGLCFVRLVAEAHGGSVSVCQAELGGAMFEMSLAASESQA